MKKKLYYALYLFGFLLILFSSLELYFNYLLNNPEKCPDKWKAGLIQYYQEYDAVYIQQQEKMACYDSSLFYTLKPGSFLYENREFSTPFQVNSLGVRDDEASLTYPKIVMLGDSYGMGWGIEQEKTYASLVEQSTGMKVLNAGISSYGTPREMRMLENIQTDSLEYLIIQFCPNDMAEITEYVRQKNRLVISSEHIYDSICDLVNNRTSYYPFKHLVQLMPSIAKKKKDLEKPKKTASAEEKVNVPKSFIELIRSSHKIPPKTKIIVFMLGKYGRKNSFISNVEDLVSKEMSTSLSDQMIFLDFSEQFDRSHYYVLDEHLNQKGHKLVGDTLISRINIMENNTSISIKRWYYPNQNVCIESACKNGIKHGITNYYWGNGEISQQTRFVYGLKDGLEIRFDENGIEIGRDEFNRGKLIEKN